MNKTFKSNRLFLFTLFFLFGLTAAFSAPQVERLWSTIRGENVPRVIPMNSVKQEIMSFTNRYDSVKYKTEPITRDVLIQDLVELRAEIKSMDGDVQAMDQEISWLKDNNSQNFACATFFVMGGVSATWITVVRGSRAYKITFNGNSSYGLSANERESFEQFIDSILR